jgi:hypothetical protein
VARSITALQRLGAALSHGRARARETDWWAVLVELVVVVVGILIAFELTNWGERRQRAENERELLQRIEEEARGDYAILKTARDDHLKSVANYRLLIHAINDPRSPDAYRRRGDAECNLLRLPAVQRQSAGTGALSGGERLELITDRKLRSLLRRADSYRTFADSQLVYFRQIFQRYGEVIEPHMPWSLGPNGTYQCGVNLDTLRQDKAAVALLPKLARDQHRFSRYREYEMNATKKVIERVACLRSGACRSE